MIQILSNLASRAVSMPKMVVFFAMLFAASSPSATSLAAIKTYQLTGNVVSITDSMIVIQKGSEKSEIARTADTKTEGDLKVGAKVTVQYTMTAKAVEAKPEKTSPKK